MPARSHADHPCFDSAARHRTARVHLPVAPRCNVQCNYCNRRFDCVAESRPGVTSTVLTPERAAEWCELVLAERPETAVVGIAGPGDPFANADETLATLRLVRARHPEVLLCVATNGLAVAPHVPALAELGVSHVTVTLNAVEPELGAKVYRWVRLDGRLHRGLTAARLLLERQLAAIAALVAHGITVKVNTILLPSINEGHVAEVARTVAALGAHMMNLMPLYPVAQTPFARLAEPHPAMVTALRATCREWLPQMNHCARCRADAVGLIGEVGPGLAERLAEFASTDADARRSRVAVASLEGVLVNQHLGEAATLRIYEAGRYVETRPTPRPGCGTARWTDLALLLHDCRALVAYQLGEAPRQALTACGVACHETDGLVLDAVAAVDAGRPLPRPVLPKACGGGCGGRAGTGC